MKIEISVLVLKKEKQTQKKTPLQSLFTLQSKKDSVSLVWTWVTVISPATFQPSLTTQQDPINQPLGTQVKLMSEYQSSCNDLANQEPGARILHSCWDNFQITN